MLRERAPLAGRVSMGAERSDAIDAELRGEIERLGTMIVKFAHRTTS